MNAKTLSLALLAASTLAASGAQAAAPATLYFQDGLNGYAGTRDTEIRFPEPNVNGGGNWSVSVDFDDGPGDNNPTHGLLAFDDLFGAGAGQIKPTDVVQNATLRVYIQSVGSGWTWNEMLQPWDEYTATWNSWTDGIQADDVEALAAPVFSDGAGNGAANVVGDIDGYYYVDVTDSLKKWQSGTLANNGWAILPFVGGTNGIDFQAGDDLDYPLDRPLLTVQVVPEPETYALMLAGLALVGLMARRRAA
jgi:hypothetical protein